MVLTKTQKRNWVIGISVFLVIILFIVFLNVMDNGEGSPFLSVTSLIITSVDFLDRISNVDDLDNSFFIISAKVGRGADEVVGSVSDATFNQKLRGAGNEDWKTDFDLTFSADIVKEEAIYQIKPQSGIGKDFKEFSIQVQKDPGATGSTPPCVGEEILFDHNFLGGDRFCIVANTIGRFGDLEQPTIQTDVGFEMKRLGSTVTGILSNIGTDSGTKELKVGGELVGKVRLTQVSESAGAKPPDEDNFKPVFIPGNNGWKLLLDSEVETYKNSRDSLEDSNIDYHDFDDGCPSPVVYGASQYNSCIKNNLDNFIKNVVSKQKVIKTNVRVLTDGKTFLVDRTSESNGKVRYIPTEEQLTNPEILLEVQASWIGVRTLVSEPEITGLECPDFTQNGEILVNVKNKGDVSSRFGVKLDDCGSFSQTVEPATKTISSQSTIPFVIQIDSQGLLKTEICTVTAFNTELPQTLKDTETISCTSKEITLCDNGEQLLTLQDGKDCVKECKDGIYPKIPKFCCDKQGVESFVNPENSFLNYRCKGNETPPFLNCQSCDEYARSVLLGWAFENQKCEPKRVLTIPTQNNLICAFSFVKILLVPIVLILGILFSFNFFQTSKQLKIKNRGIAFLIALIIGVILAISLWFLFWLGLILFVLLIAMWIALKVVL